MRGLSARALSWKGWAKVSGFNMSRIGRIPISIPNGVKVDLKDATVYVEGPLGKITHSVHPMIKVELQDGKISLKRQADSSYEKALHGLHQRLINNMIIGVTKGYGKDLEIVGVGYRAKVEGRYLVLQLGFSHLIKHVIPEGIKIVVNDNTKINIKGADKQLVGQIAADIRTYFPPEPYKGKGIRYTGEYIQRKAGKAAVAKGAAGAGGAK